MSTYRSFLQACGLLFFLAAAPVSHAAAPSVTITQGTLQGQEENGIAVFRGIPFAGDTGGDNRWRPPTPAPSWEGVRDASRFGPICPQLTASRFGPPAAWLSDFEISEDCLNLSVYTRAPAAKEKMPVMVWIHGGFARIGSGSRYDGAMLANEGVVVVTINYRLDRLGLFAHPAISAEQPDAPLANYALMDMQAALQWVKDNIEHFGGDPGNVTIFGQSSGGVAVTALMGSPLSRDLFHRAIAQSGAMADIDSERRLRADLPGRPSLEADGTTLAKELLPDADKVDAAQLRALPWQDIIAYTAKEPGNALVPVTDGKVLPQSVSRSFMSNRQMQIPLMIGTTDWEQSLYVHFELPEDIVLRGVSREDLKAAYPGLEGKALVDQYSVDSHFHAPSRFFANEHARHQHPTWVYAFEHRPAWTSDQPGAAHGDDVPYLFKPLAEPERTLTDQKDQAMSRQMIGYWTRFARTGNPNGDELPAWAGWNGKSDAATHVLEVPAHSETGLWNTRMQYHQARYRNLLSAGESE